MLESKGFKIDIDFLSDLKNIFITDLNNLGYNIKQNEKEEDICHKYFNLKKRLIQPCPREIMISKSFICPEQHQEVLEEIKNKIINGEDLKPHLSTRILDLEYDDSMLNDWGVYHLHLGKVNSGKFSKRTGDLLYTRFDNGKAYFIGVFSHDDWSNIDVIRILHDNWPDSIKRFLLKGFKMEGKRFTNEEYRQLRKAGASLFASLSDDINYILLGGGYTSSGISMQVIMSCDKLRKYFRDLQQYVIDSIDIFDLQAMKVNKKLEKNVSFKLVIRYNEVFAFEPESDIEYLIGNLCEL